MFDRRDGVVVRAIASQSVDLRLKSLVESYQKTLKNGILSSLLGVRHLGEVMENNPAGLHILSLSKAFNGRPRLYVEDGWPKLLANGNSQASADVSSKIWEYNSLSREWRLWRTTRQVCIFCP